MILFHFFIIFFPFQLAWQTEWFSRERISVLLITFPPVRCLSTSKNFLLEWQWRIRKCPRILFFLFELSLRPMFVWPGFMSEWLGEGFGCGRQTKRVLDIPAKRKAARVVRIYWLWYSHGTNTPLTFVRVHVCERLSFEKNLCGIARRKKKRVGSTSLSTLCMRVPWIFAGLSKVWGSERDVGRGYIESSLLLRCKRRWCWRIYVAQQDFLRSLRWELIDSFIEPWFVTFIFRTSLNLAYNVYLVWKFTVKIL